MNEQQKYFQKNKYIALTGALSKEECDVLTQHMFKLYKQGKLVNDDQCPMSDAVYGDSMMEQVLEKLTEPIGNIIQKKLLPTYTYARIYRPGEILKKHKDRPSCEYSATLTLGFDSKTIWPIYFAQENKEIPIQLDVGELAIYSGCELVHWRAPFKGNWHVQLFLHYVDAEGPYANHIYDGRDSLSNEQNPLLTTDTQLTNTVQPQKVSNTSSNQHTIPIQKPFYNTMYIPSTDNTLPGFFQIDSSHLPELMFTPEECQQIINMSNDLYFSTASVGGGDTGTIEKNIRSANIYSIEYETKNKWVFDKLAKTIFVANATHFDYEVSSVTHALQLIHYDIKDGVAGHYNWHVDAGNGLVATRKISASIQLSDEKNYSGCDLEVSDHGVLKKGSREKGSISMFPSYMTHRVTPIESGERWALVIWVHGSRRFR